MFLVLLIFKFNIIRENLNSIFFGRILCWIIKTNFGIKFYAIYSPINVNVRLSNSLGGK